MNELTLSTSRDHLLPLYQEHIEGLLFVSRIRQGLKNHTDTHKLADYIRWFWKYHIRLHFFQEEKILLPLIAASDYMAGKLKDDHEEIMELMISVDKDVDSATLASLANFLERHIRWEEEVFFIYLLERLSTEELDSVCKGLSYHPVADGVLWNDFFWEE